MVVALSVGRMVGGGLSVIPNAAFEAASSRRTRSWKSYVSDRSSLGRATALRGCVGGGGQRRKAGSRCVAGGGLNAVEGGLDTDWIDVSDACLRGGAGRGEVAEAREPRRGVDPPCEAG